MHSGPCVPTSEHQGVAGGAPSYEITFLHKIYHVALPFKSPAQSALTSLIQLVSYFIQLVKHFRIKMDLVAQAMLINLATKAIITTDL